MRSGAILLFFGTYLNAAWSVEFFRQDQSRFYRNGSPGLSPIISMPRYIRQADTIRSFSPFPVMRAHRPFFRTLPRFAPTQRITFPTRSFQPSMRVYEESTSFGRSPVRISSSRLHQGPLSTSAFTGTRRIVRPSFTRSLIGSQRIVQRQPLIGRRMPQGVISGRRIRLRQPSRRPSVARRPDEVIALFAVDDPRTQRTRIGQRTSAKFSRPLLSETIAKPVKTAKIVGASVEQKSESIAKIESTAIEEKKTVQDVSAAVAEAALAVDDAGTIDLTAVAADTAEVIVPVEAVIPVEQVKDVAVTDAVVEAPVVVEEAVVLDIPVADTAAVAKDIVQKTVTETKTELVVADTPAVQQTPEIISKEQTVVKAADIPVKL